MAINHAGHDHPATPAARAACRKRMSNGQSPRDESAERALAGITTTPAQMTVVPRTRGDGGVVRGAKRAKPSTVNVKRTNTQIKSIGDLADVPRMLAYGVRLAWANEWTVRVGEQFNDTERRIVIDGPVAEIALVWRPSLPDGVWGVFVRKTSITHRVSDVQTAFAMAANADAWTDGGHLA